MEYNSNLIINKKKLILIISIVLISFFLIKKQKIEKKITKMEIPKPAFIFEKADVLELKKGKGLWRFNVAKAVIDRKKNMVQLFGLKGHFLEDKKEILEVVTPTANLNLRNSNLTMFKAEFITKEAPKKVLNGDVIVWESSEERISGTGNIKLKQANMVLLSNTFWADNKLDKVKIWGEPQIIIGK